MIPSRNMSSIDISIYELCELKIVKGEKNFC